MVTAAKIYAFIKDFGRQTHSMPLPKEIAADQGFPENKVHRYLDRLVKDGLLKKIGQYHYRRADKDNYKKK